MVDVGFDDLFAAMLSGEFAIELPEEFEPTLESLGVDGVVEFEVVGRVVWIADVERGKTGSEETRRPGSSADGDVGWQVFVEAVFHFGDDRTEGGMLETAERFVPGVEKIGGAFVASFARVERTNQGDVLELLGGPRQVLADLDAVGGGFDGFKRSAGFGAWFGVPCVDVTLSAGHPEENDAFGFCVWT